LYFVYAYYVLNKKNQDVIPLLTKYLQSMFEDGTVAKMMEKYLAVLADYPANDGIAK